MPSRTRCSTWPPAATVASRFDIPALILHGDDDQIVPIGASAMRSVELIRGATLKVYEGAPHGMCTTHKDRVNEDLLAFCKGDG